MIGSNNSGKTAFLAALRCYFDDSLFKPSDLNKTEFTARQSGYNTCEITIEFDISLVEGKIRKRRMLLKHGTRLSVKKIFTYREASKTISIEYAVAKEKVQFLDGLDKDIQDIINAVSISYIHPQEGTDLLEKAQQKFKQRLFHNWGRHASMSDQLKELQNKWDELRTTANVYLSAALTESLGNFWPGSSTVIDLPANIDEIVAVSDISFRASQNLPEISLTSQGTGAQSIILYQTHYLLDSDRSLHRGFYVPIWLLEEPESFLHGDISIKLGNLLASNEWLSSIQIILSTHSPIILACSRQNPKTSSWAILNDHKVEKQLTVESVKDDDIELVSKLMGDSNFDAYFSASQSGVLFFIEDTRPLTINTFEESNIPITKALNGTSEVKKYLDVFKTIDGFSAKKAVFFLDNDKGIKEFSSLITNERKLKEKNGFFLYKISNFAYILLMPKNFSVEDLFDEFDQVLESCLEEIFDEKFDLQQKIPLHLTRAAGIARKCVDNISSMDEAKFQFKNEQDIKDFFWTKVKSKKYSLSKDKVATIKELIDIA